MYTLPKTALKTGYETHFNRLDSEGYTFKSDDGNGNPDMSSSLTKKQACEARMREERVHVLQP